MEPRTHSAATLALVLALVLVSGSACSPGSPEEKVESIRSRYEATLMGWVVRDNDRLAEAGFIEGEGVEDLDNDEALPAVADLDEELAPALAEPAPQDVTLNLQLWHNSPDMLPGITLDVSHADEQEQEKAVYRVWVDTSHLMRGQHIQLDHVLRDVQVEPGDRFSVRVRHPVPAVERGEYREFQQL